MPVTIQDVLALLPELFPRVQKIPMANIHPNPDNPGPPPTEEQIQEMADDLAGSELENPIKVWPLPSNPLREGITLHPENPRLRGDGQPWEVGDFNWEILSGELRYRGADRLGWKEIDGYILNPTPGVAVRKARKDNKVRPRGWFADWQAIENLIKAEPGLTQREVAAILRLDLPKVNRALGLLPLLNLEARALIVSDANNSNKGIRGILELPAAQLAGLGPGTGLKPGVRATNDETRKLWPYPPIPPETQDLVRRALIVAIDNEMTEAKVKAFVAWIKEGHQPEDYGVKGAVGQPQASGGQTVLSPVERPSAQTQGASAPGGILQAATAWLGGQGKGAKTKGKGRGARFGKGAGGQPQVGQPSAKAGAAFAMGNPLQGVGHWFLQLLGSVLKASLKRAVQGIIVLVLIWAGLKGLVWVIRGGHLKRPSSIVSSFGLNRNAGTPMQPGTVSPLSGAESTQPQPGHQPMASPYAKAGGTPARWAKQSKFVLDFVGNLYGISYKNLVRPQIHTLKLTKENYTAAFLAEFFPDSKIEEIKDRKLVYSFEPSGPVKFLKHDPALDEDEFSVGGTVTIQSDLRRQGEFVSSNKVTLVVYLLDHPEGIGAVALVKEVKEGEKSNPATVSGSMNSPSNKPGASNPISLSTDVNVGGVTVNGTLDSNGNASVSQAGNALTVLGIKLR